MKRIINIQEAKTHLSRYVEEVVGGQELIIGKAGKPMAKLIPYTEVKKPRALGRLSRSVKESSNAWTSETDAEIAAEFLKNSGVSLSERVGEKQSQYGSK